MLKTIEYKYLVAIIYTCVLFLDRLDITIVNIALPTMANYFHIPITQSEWISNAFLLALAISIPVSSWLGDQFGVKKVFVSATALFATAAFLCAFVPSFYLVVLLRFLQGIGGGVLIPVGMTMLYRAFKPSEYASITSFTFIPALIAPAISPALGGTIIHFLNWQWIFIFCASLCFAAVIFSIIFLQEQVREQRASLDVIGFLLISTTLILTLYLLSDFGEYGFSIKTCGLLVLAGILITLFIKQEARAKNPLMNLALFKNKLFTQTNIIQLVFQMCHYASFFVIGMYLQIGIGMSPLFAGIVIGVQAIGAMCVSRLSVRWYHIYGPGMPLMVGFIGVGIFTACLFLITRADRVLLACVIMFARGLFSGLCAMPMQITSILGFEKKLIAQASAVFNAGRQIAITLGIALASFMISYQIKQHGEINRDVFSYAFYMIILFSVIGVYLCAAINNKTALEIVRE